MNQLEKIIYAKLDFSKERLEKMDPREAYKIANLEGRIDAFREILEFLPLIALREHGEVLAATINEKLNVEKLGRLF